ncbi:MBL fold metallo-hydrolase [Microscilla marina]|uniref:Lipoyltransferase n=1 Tax=Microscilla marina ATCC 23134 TaxID=313606 RepID=A1ZEE4_MICM2|nr:MBL fold metallo-hydrolase [Microscilla marina]EAY31452.1 lipoyltransferase [Microscilla marina ATCC 23134]
MKVTVLGSGTSQGVPVIACDCEVCQSLDYRDQRLRAAIHIEVDNQSIVVDTGPDFRQQMLRERITSLDAVLYTHQHKDHTAGMDDLRSFNFKQEKDVPVYARAEVMQQLKQEFAYIFVAKEKKYPGVLNIEEFIIENRPFDINGTTIIPIEVLHHKLPVFGFRVQNFTYVTDTNYIADNEIEKMKGTEFLILDALRKEEHISHFNIDQALEVIAKVQPKQAYLTHISHKMGLHADVNAELPENVQLAYDGLQIEC